MQPPADPGAVLADVLLQREALICRVAEGRPPRDFAGMYVGDDDIDRILAALPGLDGPVPAMAAAVRERVAARLAAARAAFRAALHGGSPVAALARSARLAPPEAEVLALLAAVETSPSRQRLVAYIQDSVQLPQLTLATLGRVFAEPASIAETPRGELAHPAEPARPAGPAHPAERCVAPDAALRRAELVEVAATGPWGARICSLPSRVVWHLRGDASADPDLPAGSTRWPGTPAAGRAEPELVLVHGGDGQSRLRVVGQRRPGQGQLVCPVPEDAAQWAAVVREATLGDLVVVLRLDGPLDPAGADVVARTGHLTWVLSSTLELPLESLPRRPWQELRVASGEADPADWRAALGTAPDPAYRLSRDQLALVAAARPAGDAPLGPAVRRLAGGHLDNLAVRVRPRRGWADLVLPADDARQLRELAARHRRRGVVYGEWQFPAQPSTGIVALFAGASGTGKTLAAEVVAGELGLDLYKVDLSAVVSKYIGETEKNLERIFGAAAAGDLVLFFDEADALFGKRSEVADAHDRYANIEVAYLLQRLESYDGLVILATNLQRNIDQAFLRRISVAVDFVLPEEPQRRAIWAHSFPPAAPLAELDLDFLARQFKISGGIIHSAALGAAFLAAEEGDAITMRHVVLALKREFQKLGRLRTEAEFERYFDLVNRDTDAAPTR